MPDPRDGPDAVIRDDLDRVVRDGRLDLTGLSGASVLLTGGTGFVGRFLVEVVLRANAVSGGAPCVVTRRRVGRTWSVPATRRRSPRASSWSSSGEPGERSS